MEFKDGALYVNKLLNGYYEIIFNFGATYDIGENRGPGILYLQ